MHPRITAGKTKDAVKSIDCSVKAIAEALEIDASAMPDVRRFEPEVGKAKQLEYLAGVLERIADKVGKPADSENEETNTLEVEAQIVEKPKRGRKPNAST